MPIIAGLKLTGLNKSYVLSAKTADKQHAIFENLDLELPDAGFTVILGKSGAGKTTLIRIIAGLEGFDSGELDAPPPAKIGMVFQEPRLMPWLTVRENILFGLKRREKAAAAGRLAEIVRMVNLSDFEEAYPHQLSGGMAQRCAIARALMYDPEMILMDEPFSALDYFTREHMQSKLLEIHAATRKSIIFVTHNTDEALILAQRIIVIGGRAVRSEYDLAHLGYPRDLLSAELIEIKRSVTQVLRGE